MTHGKKCLVHGCQNYSTQGVGFYLANETGARFAPFICSPCVEMLTRGEAGNRRQSFVVALQAERDSWRLVAEILARKADEGKAHGT